MDGVMTVPFRRARARGLEMLMARTITRPGNSLTVALPPEMLKRLKLHQGSRVTVELDEERGGILIRPEATTVEGIDADFVARVDRFIERYRPALESLARR